MDNAQRALDWVLQRLGYSPRDPALFVQALTHRSAGSTHNERLEFLGDAVINLVAAEQLYRQFPDLEEGDLTRLRACLVSGEALGRVAVATGLGDVLLLGGGELKSGGFRRESTLGDALEAVCGALYLDAGPESARAHIGRLLQPAFAALPAADELKDAKTRLQEWLQARGLPLPRYAVETVSGEPHAQQFAVSCATESPALRTTGAGSSRRRAEQLAAQALLEQVQR